MCQVSRNVRRSALGRLEAIVQRSVLETVCECAVALSLRLVLVVRDKELPGHLRVLRVQVIPLIRC
jgi:uncharacterized protein (UPF0147 family)